MFVMNPVKKTYQTKTVLDFPGFSFQKGKIYAIIGANGSGKSTFARIIAGFLQPDSKAMLFSGMVPTIGYLPQKPYPFRMSLYSNLMLNKSGNQAKDNARANELIEALDLASLTSAKATHLSGGETSKMALARLLMKEYQLLILDEPTAAMDIDSTLRAENLIQKYCTSVNAAVILITHSIKQAWRIADETLFFSEGHLLEHGAARDMLLHPQNTLTGKFLEFYDL